MYGKFFLRGPDIDLVFMGERNNVIEEADRLATKHRDRKSTRLNSSHLTQSRMPSSA